VVAGVVAKAADETDLTRAAGGMAWGEPGRGRAAWGKAKGGATRRLAETTRPPTAPQESAPDDLAAHLATIEAEGQSELAAVLDDTNALFAFRRAGLIHTTPRHRLAAVLKTLEDERQAILAIQRRRVQADILLRRRLAKARVTPSGI
jgi:hypothetical protein